MSEDSLPSSLLRTLVEIRPRKGDLKRHKIIEEFIEAVAELGIEQSSVEVIAKRLKMRRTHVTYYFKTRDELIEAAAKHVSAMMQHFVVEAISGPTGWEDRIRGWVSGHFDWIKKYPSHAPFMLLTMHLCSVNKPLRKMNTIVREAGVERISALIRLKMDKRRISDADLFVLAKTLQALVAGHLLEYVTTDHKLSFRRIVYLSCDAALTCIRKA